MPQLQNLRFETSSIVDQVGRVFYHDGRVYRGIREEYEDHVKELIRLANDNNWFRFGLIDTKISNIMTEGFDLIIEHQKITFDTNKSEWTGEALRAAAVCVLRLLQKLVDDGWGLKDGHTRNVMFEGVTPYFIDIGSIIRISDFDRIRFYQEFRSDFLMPLYLFSVGDPIFARQALREHSIGVGLHLFNSSNAVPTPSEADAHGYHRDLSLPAVINFLLDYIINLELPKVRGRWSEYRQQSFSNNLSDLDRKHQLVFNLLKVDSGKTLFDVGGNRGIHSLMAAFQGKDVISGT